MKIDRYIAKRVDDVHQSYPWDDHTVMLYDDVCCGYYCPCGCRNGWYTIPISPIHEAGNAWGFTIKDDKPTLTPSIWHNKGIQAPPGCCNSHYFITDGIVRWC